MRGEQAKTRTSRTETRAKPKEGVGSHRGKPCIQGGGLQKVHGEAASLPGGTWGQAGRQRSSTLTPASLAAGLGPFTWVVALIQQKEAE